MPSTTFLSIFLSLLFALPTTLSQAPFEPPGNQILLGFWANPFETGTSPSPQQVNDALNAAGGGDMNIPVFQMSQYIPLAQVDQTTGIGGAIRSELIEQTQTDAAVYLTVYPAQGFEAVQQSDLDALAQQIQALKTPFNRTVFLRYAPEMQGGGWNVYGNQPTAFLQNWRTMYQTVKSLAPDTIIVWSPNTAQGYPWSQNFPDGANSDADRTALDTNGNGELDTGDDAYRPYWPGYDFVDWMGLSIYYNGPGGEPGNTPENPGFCGNIFDGISNNGNGGAVTEFYKTYCEPNTTKACMISECGTSHHVDINSGSSDLDIKTSWINDCIANTTFLDTHPRIKLIQQFEFLKIENSNDEADHRFTNNSEVTNALVTALKGMGDRFVWAKPLSSISSTSSSAAPSSTESPSSPLSSTAPSASPSTNDDIQSVAKKLIPSLSLSLIVGGVLMF